MAIRAREGMREAHCEPPQPRAHSGSPERAGKTQSCSLCSVDPLVLLFFRQVMEQQRQESLERRTSATGASPQACSPYRSVAAHSEVALGLCEELQRSQRVPVTFNDNRRPREQERVGG